MLVQFVCWLIIITMETEVCSKIERNQLNYGLRPQILGTV